MWWPRFAFAVFCLWMRDRVLLCDPAILLWDIVSVLLPSVFTIVRVEPLGERVTVLVTEPAGFVTVCVLTVVPGAVVWNECVLMALGLLISIPGIAPDPGFLFRCAAKGIQTSRPAATIVNTLFRILSSFPLTSLASELG